MATIEDLARAALRRDSLELRGLAQDFLRDTPRFDTLPRPALADARLLALAAALVELLAARREQPAPAWTAEAGPLAEPFYLLESAESMWRLRELCQTQAPEPLRKRRLYAPPNFLEFA
jgi:hypothetical protein